MKRELWNVMALDPGGSTGVMNVIVPVDGGRLRYSAVETLDKARAAGLTYRTEIELSRWQDHVDLIVRAVRKGREWVAGKAEELGYDGFRQVLVPEGFVSSDAVLAGDPYSPVKILACLEWAFGPEMTIEVQDPSRKAQITDARLRLWGWYAPGKPHMNDASRHMFVYLRGLENG